MAYKTFGTDSGRLFADELEAIHRELRMFPGGYSDGDLPVKSLGAPWTRWKKISAWTGAAFASWALVAACIMMARAL
jgi:hypothetical protein